MHWNNTEAFTTGWISVRWIVSSAGIITGFVGTGLRLRKASLIRNHQSPVDFITDRYQSQILRYAVATMQIITSTIYVSAQVVALKSTFNSLFDISPNNPWAVVVMFAFILFFEWIGGLASVALTDCVQGFIMAVSFVMTATVVRKNFGGWSDLDPQTYPRPDFYQTPTGDQQWSFWQFTFLNVSFFTLPHLIQRIYSAKDLASLKVAWYVMNFGPWSTMLVSIFLGTVGVQFLNGNGGTSPFASILNAMMDLGGFPEAVGVLAFTASLAAIMSTADSLVIAISQLVTVEFVYPFRPTATPKDLTWIGRFVSLVTVIVALLIGIYWVDGISDLGKIQFPLTLMIIPPFLFGLFAREWYDVHPWCLSAGMVSSSLYIVLVYFFYMKKAVDPIAIDAGVTGLLLNLGLTGLLELGRRTRNRRRKRQSSDDDGKASVTQHDDNDNAVNLTFPDRPSWDIPQLRRFGDRALTPRLLRKAMEGVEEPLTKVWFVLLVFLMLSFTTPMVAELLPPIPEDLTTYFPATVNGMPWWAFKILMVVLVPYLMNLVMIYKVPDDFPIDEKQIATHGINPDLVELTPAEMGRRSSYDARNEMVAARRSTIAKTMTELGLRSSDYGNDDARPEEPEPTLAQRRLSAMVLGYGEGLDGLSVSKLDAPHAIDDEEELPQAAEESAAAAAP